MKTRNALVLMGLLASCGPVIGQQPANVQPGVRVARQAQPTTADDSQTQFDLNFVGGTPQELVAAIEKASGTPVNVVIPSEHASMRLPPLKMKSVTVSQLFAALTRAGEKPTW